MSHTSTVDSAAPMATQGGAVAAQGYPLTTAPADADLMASALARVSRAQLAAIVDRDLSEIGRWASGQRAIPGTVRRAIRALLAEEWVIDALLVEDNGCIDPLAALASRGMSRTQLAAALDRTPEEVTRWTCGTRPLPRTVHRLCVAMLANRRLVRLLLGLAHEEAVDRPEWVAWPAGAAVDVQAGPLWVSVPAPAEVVGSAAWVRAVRGAVLDLAIGGTLEAIGRLGVMEGVE